MKAFVANKRQALHNLSDLAKLTNTSVNRQLQKPTSSDATHLSLFPLFFFCPYFLVSFILKNVSLEEKYRNIHAKCTAAHLLSV